MKIEFNTKTFAITDHRTNRYKHNQGIYICAGHGDGLYCLTKEKLLELREAVDKILELLETDYLSRMR